MYGRTKARLARQCEAFNRAHPVGSTVRVWSSRLGGTPVVVQVREPGAFILSGHTAVVYVSGVRGCIALSHVAEFIATASAFDLRVLAQGMRIPVVEMRQFAALARVAVSVADAFEGGNHGR